MSVPTSPKSSVDLYAEKEQIPFFQLLGHTLINNPVNPAEGSFTVYVLEVQYKKKWRLLRRFRDFEMLHQQLSRVYNNIPHFPPKKYVRSQTPDFIEKRQLELTVYMRQLFEYTMTEPETITSPSGTSSQSIHAQSRRISSSQSVPNLNSEPASPKLGGNNDADEGNPLQSPSEAHLTHFQKRPLFWTVLGRFLELDNSLVISVLSEGEEERSMPTSSRLEQILPRAMEFAVPRSRPTINVNAADSVFFQVLKSKFPSLYQTILDKGCTLLLPRQFIGESSRKYVTKDLIEMHSIYLSESGTFYHTLDRRTVFITAGEVKTSPDFPLELSRAIMGEELIYDEQSRSLKVICIEGPIEPKAEFQALIQQYIEEEVHFPERHSLKDYAIFLREYPENIPPLRQALYHMYRFNEGHVGTSEAINVNIAQNHIRKLVNKLYQDLVSLNPKYLKLTTDSEQNNMLLQIISNFVVGGCSHRIQLLIHSEYAKFDYEVLQCFGKLQGISYENFGLRDEFQIPCMEAITELDLLSHCQTPMEKLVCIRSASEKIVEEIGKSQEAMTEGSEVLTVATDDMLSLFVYSMIKAKPKRVRSDIVFIDIFFLGFGFNNHMTRDLEFYFANFQAAVSYITKDAEAHMIRGSLFFFFSFFRIFYFILVIQAFVAKSTHLNLSEFTAHFFLFFFLCLFIPLA
eukprot:TRINITY_DN4247_c0_g1_i3.p1 TRINITY_DN4247_c0_g1~~TRINITY_DN4247_c0_g1_i3.p1  ORF type:complete len:686 (+),score=124.71 TRINITY_DN4247_c0_g1_i3:63-2120(+)